MSFMVLPPGTSALDPVGDDVGRARKEVEQADLAGSGQDALRDQVLAFIDANPDCLHRSCPPGHLTGSAFVVDPEAGAVLLIHHAKLDRWLQPGGHADGEGNLGAVALAEATEETGLVGLSLVTPAFDLDVHPIGARPGEPAHHHHDLRYLVLAGVDRRPAPNHETLGARWVGPDDPAIMASVELSRAVARALDVARSLPTGTI